MSIGQAIRMARRARGWSQPELASKVGVAPETVCRWETGAMPVPLITRLGLESVLGPLNGKVESKRLRKVAAKS